MLQTDHLGLSEVSVKTRYLQENHISNPHFRASPPYYSVLLYSLDFAAYAIPLVGKMFYAFRIAPPDLIATTIAVASVFLFTIGKGRYINDVCSERVGSYPKKDVGVA